MTIKEKSNKVYEHFKNTLNIGSSVFLYGGLVVSIIGVGISQFIKVLFILKIGFSFMIIGFIMLVLLLLILGIEVSVKWLMKNGDEEN